MNPQSNFDSVADNKAVVFSEVQDAVAKIPERMSEKAKPAKHRDSRI